MTEVWIDVGAHQGESSFAIAEANPHIMVYAFEPNLRVAAEVFGILDNYVVIPMAVSETDGFSQFHLNAYTGASSLYEFNPQGLADWVDGQLLQEERIINVPTLRLDSFMEQMQIPRVSMLKIDAQGADFSVVKSAGDRLVDIDTIVLEVAVTRHQLYKGAAEKIEVVAFLQDRGFRLIREERQFHDQEENLTFERRMA